MPLAPRRVVLGLGCLGVALLAALPALSSRSAAPVVRKAAPAPAVAMPPAAPEAAPVAIAAAPAPVAKAVKKSHAAPGQAGMMLYLDPESGKYLSAPADPPPTESFGLPVVRTPAHMLRVTPLRRGGTMVELDETYHEVSIVRIDANGKAKLDCGPPAEMAKLMGQPAPVIPAAPAAPVEE